MTLSVTLVFLYMSFDYSLAICIIFLMTAWIYVW